MSEFVVRPVTPQDTRPLRRALLHRGDPPFADEYPGDDHPDALHLGGYREGRLAAVATLLPEAPPGGGDPDRAYRVRGVAVDHGYRGLGLGGLLLERLLEHAAARGARTVWAEVPAGAYGFFARFGLTRQGDPTLGGDGTPRYPVAARFRPAGG